MLGYVYIVGEYIMLIHGNNVVLPVSNLHFITTNYYKMLTKIVQDIRLH